MTDGTEFDISANGVNSVTTVVGSDMSLVAVAGDTYNAYFDFSSRPSAADDPLRGNLPDPNGDQALLDNAFNPCFIKPVVWPDETHAAWHYDFAAAVGEPRSTVAGRAQDFASAHKHPNMPLLDNDHWVVHVISGYKLSDVMVLGTLDQYDNDPDTNLASTGLTYATGQYATFLWEEIERDVASEHGWSAAQSQRNRALTLIHEVGHWLVPGTGHNYGPNPTDIMWVAQYNTWEAKYHSAPAAFTLEHQRGIRESIQARPR